MKRAEATKYGAALEAAGVIVRAGVSGKLSQAQRSVHGPSFITCHWAETPQRRAPERLGTIGCVDVAEAMLAGGWSVEALRACTHTANARRLAAAAAAAAAVAVAA